MVQVNTLVRGFKRFLALLLVFVVFLFILELAARAVYGGFLKEKISPQILRTEFEEIYVPPFAEKEPSEFRIFVYGGSTVKGIPLEKIGFVSQLQYQLHHVFGGKNIKVYNLGWAGFNTTRIRYLFERTIDQNPDLVIIYTGENEFIYPQLDFYLLVRAASALKNRSDLAKIIMYLVKKGEISQKTGQESSTQKTPAYGASKLLVNLKMEIFKNNLLAITKQAQKREIPLILGIPAHNILDMPPVDRDSINLPLPKDYQKEFKTAKMLLKKNNLKEAKVVVDSLLAKYPKDPPLLYLKAKIAYQNGQIYKDTFIEAKDKDFVPWRTTTKHANFIRSFSSKENIYVIDFDKILSNASPDNLIGFNLILDGTHPNKEGAYIIAKSIVEFIKKEKLITDKWLNETKKLYLKKELFKTANITQNDDAYVYLKTAGLILKRPLFKLNIAKYYIKKAEKIDNSNWEAKALKAVIAHLEGKSEEAKAFLKTAKTLKDPKTAPSEYQSIPYLSEIITD